MDDSTTEQSSDSGEDEADDENTEEEQKEGEGQDKWIWVQWNVVSSDRTVWSWLENILHFIITKFLIRKNDSFINQSINQSIN